MNFELRALTGCFAFSTWHSHTYDVRPRQPTPHLIVNILGMTGDRERISGGQHTAAAAESQWSGIGFSPEDGREIDRSHGRSGVQSSQVKDDSSTGFPGELL